MKKLLLAAVVAALLIGCTGSEENNAGHQNDGQVIVSTKDSAVIEQLYNQASELDQEAEQLNESLDSLLNDF